jgi:hypothetical protein
VKRQSASAEASPSHPVFLTDREPAAIISGVVTGRRLLSVAVEYMVDVFLAASPNQYPTRFLSVCAGREKALKRC